FRAAGAPPLPGPLTGNLPATFVEQSYFLVRTNRAVTVYRGYETRDGDPRLRAPFGKDHPSIVQGLVQSRHPGTEKGWWWTPARPSLAIDDLRLSDLHYGEPRS